MNFWRSHYLFVVLLICSIQNSLAQQKPELLLLQLKNAKQDTAKFEIQLRIADLYKTNGEYLRCRDHINNAAAIAKKVKSKSYEMRVMMANGGLFLQQGNYAISIKSFFKALKIARAIKDDHTECRLLDQIGIVYWYEGQLNKGLGYLLEAYAIAEENGDINSMAGILNNLGLIYRKQGNYDKAEKYYLQSAELFKKLNNPEGLSDVLNNIGIIHQYNADFEKAIEYYNESLKLREDLDDKIGITTSLENLGTAFMALKNLPEAEKYLFRALEISESIDDIEGIKGINSNLSDLYLSKGDGIKALEYYKKYIEAKEKVDNAIIEKETYQQELAYNYEKEKLNNQKEQEKRNIQTEAVRKKQKLIIYVSLGILLLVIVFSLFLYSRFKITKRQKLQIEIQKKEVEVKNKEIIDSINYAKRLQDAILPPVKLFSDTFSDAFVLYQPKDIVAGDFYFLESIGDLKVFGVADCTGHGVPGALVSVVCSNALHRVIVEFGIAEPGKILDKVRELVLQTFEKSSSEVKDGMDISLCVYNAKTQNLKWAGANNPLWIAKENPNDLTGILELKADKQAIGYVANPKPFTTHEVILKKGEAIYLFSDGYSDQFGGKDGKKFMYRNFQRKIDSIWKLSMVQQRQELHTSFENWKDRKDAPGNGKRMEQTDDVCVIGVRV